MKLTKLGMALALTYCFAGAASAAPTLLVSNTGQLHGATGVVVDGKSYDVSFKTGSCASLYTTCRTENFLFSSQASAALASKALIDQVFVDGVAGLFDSNPVLTAGCTSVVSCEVFVPYLSTMNDGNMLISLAITTNTYARDSTTYLTQNEQGLDRIGAVYARFTSATDTLSPVAAVPEPATWTMMLLGFGLVAGATRFRRRTVKVSYA